MHSHSLPEASLPDQRYAPIHDAIASGRITRFAQLLDYLTSSELAALLDLDLPGLMLLMRDPELMQVKQLVKLAQLFKVDYFVLFSVLREGEIDRQSTGPL